MSVGSVQIDNGTLGIIKAFIANTLSGGAVDGAIVPGISPVGFNGEQLVYPQDTATFTGQQGTFALVTRSDGATTLTAVNQHSTFLIVDANGRLHVAPPPRARTTDSMAVAQQVDALMNGLTVLTPRKMIDNVPASATDRSLVTAQASKIIRVHQLVAVVDSSGAQLTFNSKGAGAGTAISPMFPNPGNGGEVLPFSPVGWFDTNPGEALTVTTGPGSITGLMLAYTQF